MIDKEKSGCATYILRPSMLALSLVSFIGVAGLLLVSWATGVADELLPAEPTRELEPLDFVVASVETDPVPSEGDAADDPAIWVHPTDPALSTIIGTDKQGGIAVYDLQGQQIQYLPHGRLNNVDVRYKFPLAADSVALVVASDREDRLAIYKVNPNTRLLEDVVARQIDTGISAYGLCMYHSHMDGRFYAIINSEEGEVEQWELFATEDGKVDARSLRTFDVGERTEGCVADDEYGDLYIGVQEDGIWKYDAEPGAAIAGDEVDDQEPRGYIASEVEGLTLYQSSNGAGYLIASSQTRNAFIVYRRDGNNDFVMAFKIQAANGIDEVTHTDGIDTTSASLGPAFPEGVFVAQDHSNGNSNQNFKLVSWQEIRVALEDAQTSPLVRAP